MRDQENDRVDAAMQLRDRILFLSEDETQIVAQALAYFESQMAGSAASAESIGWRDSAARYRKKLHITEALREHLRNGVEK